MDSLSKVGRKATRLPTHRKLADAPGVFHIQTSEDAPLFRPTMGLRLLPLVCLQTRYSFRGMLVARLLCATAIAIRRSTHVLHVDVALLIQLAEYLAETVEGF